MTRQEVDDAMRLLNVQVLLTADQVAAEILSAVTEGRRDLTLAPNPDIAFALQLFGQDQDKAEDLMGEAIRQRLAQVASQHAQ